MTTVLVVDDEVNIRDVVRYTLEQEGFAVCCAADGRRGLELALAGGIDLIVLDVLMPELDGLGVCRRLRDSAVRTPIVFLSSRGEEIDRVLGLDLGGDDYLPKPFSPRELAARVRSVLRRAAEPPGEKILSHGALTMTPARHELRAGDASVELTVTEYAVLRALLEHPGRVFSRTQLIPRGTHITERTIDTHIRRIRAKLRAHGLDPIETVHGVGYRV
jgi:two-component system OmpR family response regulator